VTGGWRKLDDEELHSLYSSPSIIKLMKSRRMRWAGHVARMEEKRNAYRILVGKPSQDVGGFTILKWILERYDGMVWIGLLWLRIGISGGLL
jgi:hypothetical protein